MPAVSLNEDIDTDKELVAHGFSNFLAGACGTVYAVFSFSKTTHVTYALLQAKLSRLREHIVVSRVGSSFPMGL
jgi:hypothetical protein